MNSVSETLSHQAKTDKSNLDQDDFNSYRPISNLSFMSKTIESVVSVRFHEHCEACSLLPVYQYSLRTIRSSLTPDALRDAAYALILSRLDYSNALYLNAPMCELHMLINTAARVVSGRSRFDHITDFVKDVLHWLPITKKSTFQSVHFGLQVHSWACTDVLI